MGLHRVGNVGDAVPHHRLGNAFIKRLFGNRQEALGGNGNRPYWHGDRRVSIVAIDDNAEIEADNITLLENLPRRDTVNDCGVDRGTKRVVVDTLTHPVAFKSRYSSTIHYELLRKLIQRLRGHTRLDLAAEGFQYLCHDFRGAAHLINLFGGFQLNAIHLLFVPCTRERRLRYTESIGAVASSCRSNPRSL